MEQWLSKFDTPPVSSGETSKQSMSISSPSSTTSTDTSMSTQIDTTENTTENNTACPADVCIVRKSMSLRTFQVAEASLCALGLDEIKRANPELEKQLQTNNHGWRHKLPVGTRINIPTPKRENVPSARKECSFCRNIFSNRDLRQHMKHSWCSDGAEASPGQATPLMVNGFCAIDDSQAPGLEECKAIVEAEGGDEDGAGTERLRESMSPADVHSILATALGSTLENANLDVGLVTHGPSRW